jgi:hypothetical protein
MNSKLKLPVICAAAATLLGVANTSALPVYTGTSPFNYTTDGVVGTIVAGSPASPANEVDYVNNLLGIIGANVTSSISGHTYKTGATDYSGTVSNGVQDKYDDTKNNIVPAGHDYVLAKYGDNDVVFYLGGNSVTLPLNGASLFMNPPGRAGLGLSHFTVFGTPTVNTPDGGATAALLGLGFLGMAAFRKVNA